MSKFLEELEEKQRLANEARQQQVEQRFNEIEARQRAARYADKPPRDQLLQNVQDASEMSGNYPESLAGYGKQAVEGLTSMITDPVGAAKEAVRTGEAALELGGRKFEEFIHADSEQMPIPHRPDIEQPMTDLGEYYKGKYGTWDMARQSFIQDPVGSTADVFPFLGQRFGPAAAARKAASTPTGKMSDRLYRRAAGIPKSDPRSLDLAREAARRNIIISEGGLNKNARHMRRVIGEDIEKLIKDRVARGGDGVLDDLGLVSTQTILKHMDELIDAHRNTYDADVTVPFLKKEKVRLMTLFGGRGHIGLDTLQEYKTKTYKQAYETEQAGAKPEIETLGAKTEAQRATARAAKETLMDRVPGYSKLNREFEVYAQMIPYIKQAIDRAPDDGLARLMNATIDNPRFQSILAVAMRKAADGDFGWLEQNLNTPEIRTVLYLTGEHFTPSDEPVMPPEIWGGKQ